jgi:hypothetical protein
VRRALVSLLALVLAGCAGDSDGVLPPAPLRPVSVYFLRGDRIGVATREISPAAGVMAAAMRELLAGPNAQERGTLTTAIPERTRLLGVDVDGEIATVDLTRQFELGGGSLSMQARVAQVVHTLTQFPAVIRVAFRIEGRPVEAIGGEGVIVDPAVDREDFEDLAPAILVESPGPGDTLTAPLQVRGTANTFEATLYLRVVDKSGAVLVDRFVTATSGSGTRGTFETSLPIDAATVGNAKLVAYERSAENGAEINAVTIPIRLSRR